MKPLEEKIKERLECYESRLPNGDIDEFKALLDKAERPKRKLIHWTWMAPVAAGVALVFFLVHHPESEKMKGIDKRPIAAEIIEQTVQEVQGNDDQYTVVNVAPTKPVLSTHTYAQSTVTAADDEHDAVPEVEVEECQNESDVQELVDALTLSDVDTSAVLHSNETASSVTDNVRKPKRRKALKIATGTLGCAGGVLLACLLPSTTSEPLEEWDGVTDIPQIADEESGDDSHSFPLRIGLSLRIPIHGRWSITTGMDYSIYSSKIGYTVSGYKRQKVHFIDIPVRADFTLVRNRWVNVYVGAGASADFCVAASLNGNNMEKDRIGCSLIGGGGAQFNINRHLGLFVDPTFSWDVCSGHRILKTYKSEHPFMFTVTGGMRITL